MRILSAGLLALLSCSCGLQLTSGVTDASEHASAHTATLAVTTQATREHNAALGLASAGVMKNGFAFRTLTLHAGYDYLAKPGWITLELGGDVGGGEPLTRTYGGLAAYLGVSGTARFRLTPGGDRERTFNLFYPMLDLVLAPQAGFWGPPEGTAHPDPMFEYGVAIGIRAAFASDVVAPRIGAQQDGETPEKAKPWRD